MNDQTHPSPRRADRRPGSIPAGGALLALVVSLVAAPLFAESNKLANGDFPTSTISPWAHDTNGTNDWAAIDFQSQSGSGSLAVIDSNGNTFFDTASNSECVGIAGGSQVQIGAWFRSAAGSPGGSTGRLQVYFYSDASCSGSAVSYAYLPYTVYSSSSWTFEGRLAGTNAIQAPAGAGGLRIVIHANSTSTSVYTLYADGIFVYGPAAEPSPSIFEDGFEGGDCSAWTSSN